MSAEARPVLLDITRLIGRAGAGPLTGIDRVERAYIRALTARRGPVGFICRTAVDFLVTTPDRAPKLLSWIDDAARLPDTSWLARTIARGRRTPALEAALRARSTACATHGRLARALAALGDPPVWLNVGHTNLEDRQMRALRRTGARLVVMIHDTIPIDHPEWSGPRAPAEFGRRLEAALAHAGLILCPSTPVADAVRRRARAAGHLPELLVAPLGVAPAPPQPGLVPAGLPLDRPYFVALGTIEPRKDHGLLLDLWARFQAELPPGHIPRLFIVGRRGWRNEAVFRRLDSAPFVGSTVFELPDLPDGAASALLAGAAALLQPSRAEGFGLAAAEAAVLGVPVIASDLPVTREVLGSWPVYAPAGDMYAWKNAIITMARQAGGRQARPSPARLPGWEAHFNLVFSRL